MQEANRRIFSQQTVTICDKYLIIVLVYRLDYRILLFTTDSKVDSFS